MELDRVKSRKKITNIVIHRLPREEREQYPAFIFDQDPDTLCINPDFDRWFKENCIKDNVEIWTAIITHEEIHKILIEFGDQDTNKLDNIAPTVRQNMFFVDGNWTWLSLR